jgi:8-oxo-dGTP pyrophosphatase MutT (NUDIX family)
MSKIIPFIQQFQQKLALGLPGNQAHQVMAPITRQNPKQYEHLKKTAIPSAVNVLFVEHQYQICIVLTQRHDYEGHHGGQISLPGGKLESSDPSAHDAAMRETHEELGIPLHDLDCIGALTDFYIPPSNYWVYPHVSYILELPHFYPDPKEVHSLIFLPIHEFLNPKLVSTFSYKWGDAFIENPCFLFENKVIWGATAMILQEVKDILKIR